MCDTYAIPCAIRVRHVCDIVCDKLCDPCTDSACECVCDMYATVERNLSLRVLTVASPITALSSLFDTKNNK